MNVSKLRGVLLALLYISLGISTLGIPSGARADGLLDEISFKTLCPVFFREKYKSPVGAKKMVEFKKEEELRQAALKKTMDRQCDYKHLSTISELEFAFGKCGGNATRAGAYLVYSDQLWVSGEKSESAGFSVKVFSTQEAALKHLRTQVNCSDDDIAALTTGIPAAVAASVPLLSPALPPAKSPASPPSVASPIPGAGPSVTPASAADPLNPATMPVAPECAAFSDKWSSTISPLLVKYVDDILQKKYPACVDFETDRKKVDDFVKEYQAGSDYSCQVDDRRGGKELLGRKDSITRAGFVKDQISQAESQKQCN